MKKLLITLLLAATSILAAPILTVNFGSTSGRFGNLQVNVTGLGESEVLSFWSDWSVTAVYPADYLPTTTFVYGQPFQAVQDGSFYAPSIYGVLGVPIGDGRTYDVQLNWLKLTVSSNVSNFVQTYYVSPSPGQQYVSLSPIRTLEPTGVPEPSTYAAVGLGLLLLGLTKKKGA